MTAPPTTVRFTLKILQLLREAAAAHGKSISEIVNDCVSMALPRVHPFYRKEAEIQQDYEEQLFVVRQAIREQFLQEAVEEDRRDTQEGAERSIYEEIRTLLRGNEVPPERVEAARALLKAQDPEVEAAIIGKLSNRNLRSLGFEANTNRIRPGEREMSE